MCGIFGVYNINSNIKFDEEKFGKALNKISHRGPDAQKSQFIENKYAMGHVRLSIIDLQEENHQPFRIDNRYWIIYNGEVFNYIELRAELIGFGYNFRTNGDTEVVLTAFKHWGTECVKKFNGMWSFAIYDELNNKLFCSRDRFGVKPFNYAIVNDQFVFCSEIKSIIHYFPNLCVPNYNVISNYCRNSIGAQIEETWFEKIFRLKPAHNIIIDKNGIKIERYWDYPKNIEFKKDFSQAILEYNNIIKNAVDIRMRSDVPIGFTLSSGIDSASLVSLTNANRGINKKTYTAAFPNNKFERSEKKNFNTDIEIDEPSIVKRLTSELGLEPNIIDVKYNNYINELKTIIYHLESGHGSPAIFPLNEILKVASKDVTVVLEGQGADELLGGYINTIFPVYFIDLIKRFKFKDAFNELKAFKKVYSVMTSFMLYIRQSDLTFVKRVYYKFSGINDLFIGRIKEYKHIPDFPIEPIGFDDKINEHLYKAHTGGLVNLLHYGDAISMAHSLESRLPFMDYRLVEFVFKLPPQYKLHAGLGKYIHRKAMKGIVPYYILDNPVKFGFESPLTNLFKNTQKDSPFDILLSDRCLNRKLFNKSSLIKVFDEQRRGKKDHSRTLFRLLNVELWFRNFID